MLYMLYSNLLSIVQAWIAQGRLAPAVGFWVVHAVMLALTLVLFSRRAFALSWPRLRWPWRRRAASAPVARQMPFSVPASNRSGRPFGIDASWRRYKWDLPLAHHT